MQPGAIGQVVNNTTRSDCRESLLGLVVKVVSVVPVGFGGPWWSYEGEVKRCACGIFPLDLIPDADLKQLPDLGEELDQHSDSQDIRCGEVAHG